MARSSTYYAIKTNSQFKFCFLRGLAICAAHGSNANKSDWLYGMVTTWVAAVETLALLAGNYPQAAYAGFTFYLQNEWQYMQRVTSDTAPYFALLEVAIRKKFLPALLKIATSDLDGKFRKLLTLSVKTGGIVDFFYGF